MAPSAFARGWHIFPLQPDSKYPYQGFKWRELSSADPAQIEKWKTDYPGCNWGVDCGKSGLAVVDIDTKKVNGFNAIADRDLEGFGLDSTLVIQTPSGGEHHVYRGDLANTVEKLGPGLDTRGSGGYILLPGSKIHDNHYTITNDAGVSDLPGWVKDRGGAGRERDVDHGTPLVELDQEFNIARAAKYLKDQAPLAVEGAGGDATTFQVAAMVRDLGVSKDKSAELMLEHWNPRCSPPWMPEQLSLKISNAYEYSQNQPGSKTLEAIFDAPVVESFKVLDRPVDFMDMFNEPPPPREWLVNDVIPLDEMVLLTGKPGAGKSTVALQLAASVAYGAPWLGMPVQFQMPVVYIGCEDSDREVHQRIYQIGQLPEYGTLDLTRGLGQSWGRVGKENTLAMENRKTGLISTGPFHEPLVRYLEEMPKGRKFLILDTLADMFTGNENDRGQVNQFVKGILGALKERFELTILTLAHPAKSDDSSYSGSTAWPGTHRAHIWMRPYDIKDPKTLDHVRTLELVKTNYSKPHKIADVTWERGAYRVIDTRGEIFDDHTEINKDNLVKVIDKAWKKGLPFSLSINARPHLQDATVVDYDGRVLDWPRVKSLANKMIIEERIIEELWGPPGSKKSDRKKIIRPRGA